MRRALIFVVGSFLVACVAGAVALVFFHFAEPEPVDWRAAIEHAIEGGECDTAAVLANDAAYARIAEGADVFGQLVSAAGDSPCPLGWPEDQADLWPTEDAYFAHLAEAANTLRSHAAFYTDRQSAAPGRVTSFFYDLLGYRVRMFGTHVNFGDEYQHVPFGQRLDYAVWQLRCGHALGRFDRPNWPTMETGVRGYFDLETETGPWAVFERDCAEWALSLALDLGLDAPGPVGALAEEVFNAARALNDAQFLWASRALAEGKFGLYEPQSAEDRVDFMRDVFRTLGLLVWEGHGPTLALYGRHLLDGMPPEYDGIKLGMLAADPPLSDTQYAYGLLTLAHAAGEDVADDLARAKEGLSQVDLAAAVEWADGVEH